MQLWQRVRTWKLTRRDKVIAGVTVALIIIGLTQINYGCGWTGFGPCDFVAGSDEDFRPEKTLWDWLGLLIVPAVLALGAIYFNRAERQNESRIAEQRAQDALLQAYLDQMTELLLAEKLRKSEPGDEVRHVAQVRTLIALRRLDRERRDILMQFLRASQLVGIDEAQMIIDFRDVDLSNADLSGASISSISLEGANLQGANLQGANLQGANLQGANLQGANLQGADFMMANLTRTYLSGADLSGADLTRAYLSRADLSGSHLQGAKLESTNLEGTNLEGANLHRAYLFDADLAGARLHRANLQGADLHRAILLGANLHGANLRGANLSDAKVTQQELECALSLEGVVMPNGSQVARTGV